MDYKYIKQLLERYWNCETSIEEEQILKTFFSQKEVPEELRKYKSLFEYISEEPQKDTLGEDFDERLCAMVQEEVVVKARTVNITAKFKPLFKAAAIVAIFLTLGNAMQVPFRMQKENHEMAPAYEKLEHGTPVAMGDTTKSDSIKRSTPTAVPQTSLILK